MEHNFYKRYCGSYLLAYVVATAIIMVFQHFASFQISGGINIVIAMVSAILPGSLFFKDYARVPDKSERRKFAIVTFLAVTILSFAVLGILLAFVFPHEVYEDFMAEFSTLPVWALPLIIVIVTLLYYFVIGSGFALGAKIQVNAQIKAQARKEKV